jgi:hypothetical protein
MLGAVVTLEVFIFGILLREEPPRNILDAFVQLFVLKSDGNSISDEQPANIPFIFITPEVFINPFSNLIIDEQVLNIYDASVQFCKFICGTSISLTQD